MCCAICLWMRRNKPSLLIITHWNKSETVCRSFIAGMVTLFAREKVGWMIWALKRLEDNPRSPPRRSPFRLLRIQRHLDPGRTDHSLSRSAAPLNQSQKLREKPLNTFPEFFSLFTLPTAPSSAPSTAGCSEARRTAQEETDIRRTPPKTPSAHGKSVSQAEYCTPAPDCSSSSP